MESYHINGTGIIFYYHKNMPLHRQKQKHGWNILDLTTCVVISCVASSFILQSPVGFTIQRATISYTNNKHNHVHKNIKLRIKQNDEPDHDVIIVGGSIVGLATAVTLSHAQLKTPSSHASSHATAQRHIRTHVFERASTLEPTGALLSMFPNGRRALQCILRGLKSKSSPEFTLMDVLDRQSIPLRGTIIKSVKDGEMLDERSVMNDVQSKKEGGNNKSSSSGTFILWHQLQRILLEALSLSSGNESYKVDDNSCLSLGCEFQRYTVDNVTGWAHATFTKRSTLEGDDKIRTESFTKSCRILIGADGVRSTLRPQVLSRKNAIESNPEMALLMQQQDRLKDTKIRSYERLVFRALIDVESINLPPFTDDNKMTAKTDLIPPNGIAVLYKSAVNVGQIFKVWSCSEGETIALTSTASTMLPSASADNSTLSNKKPDGVVTQTGKTNEFCGKINEKAVRQWTPENVKSNWKHRFYGFPKEVVDIIDCVPATSIYVNCVSDLDLNYGEGNNSSCPLLPWSNGLDPCVLVGDAVHAMTPSLGQGANVGLEDALELGCLLNTAFSEQDCVPKNVLLDAIQKFQSARNHRVIEIHRSSREQALNKHTADSTLKGYQERHQDFFERLYDWKPTFSRGQ